VKPQSLTICCRDGGLRTIDADVLIAIAEERQAQDAQWGGPKHDDKHGGWDWLLFVERQLRKAGSAQETSLPEQLEARFVKIAALAIAALESRARLVRTVVSPTAASEPTWVTATHVSQKPPPHIPCPGAKPLMVRAEDVGHCVDVMLRCAWCLEAFAVGAGRNVKRNANLEWFCCMEHEQAHRDAGREAEETRLEPPKPDPKISFGAFKGTVRCGGCGKLGEIDVARGNFGSPQGWSQVHRGDTILMYCSTSCVLKLTKEQAQRPEPGA
jgi:hypothetical protein